MQRSDLTALALQPRYRRIYVTTYLYISSSRAAFHTLYVVLEIGVLEAVFPNGADPSGIADEVVYVHLVRYVSFEYGLQAVCFISLGAVLDFNNFPLVVLDVPVHSAGLYLEIQGKRTELTVDFIIMVIDCRNGIGDQVFEQGTVTAPMDIFAMKVLPFGFEPKEQALAEPIR